jgi:putative transposase
MHADRSQRWQEGYWDTTIRRSEDLESKWEYVRNNPVRKGLVGNPDDWPFQGEINVLEW